MTNLETDILIIGGGIAGCIAAISLAETHRVILIDKLSEPNERIGESLAPAAQRILRRLNLWNGIQKLEQELYIQNMGMQSYWGSDQLHIVDHLRNPDGFVLNLNRQAFETHLRKATTERGVKCIWSAKLHSSRYEDGHWYTETTSDTLKTHHISARFVIDATGRQSHFSRIQGVKRTVHDKLIASWATMTNYNQNTMSTISACENGWWYSAVVPNNKRVLAFHTDSDLIARNTLKNLDSFLQLTKGNHEITKLLVQNKGDIVYHGTVSANSTCLDQVAGQQWAAIGDAAISFDPLSSQGMFHAMANALQLSDLISVSNCVKEHHEIKSRHFQEVYTHQIDKIWQHYLKHKHIFYGGERRWKDAEFWRRRVY